MSDDLLQGVTTVLILGLAFASLWFLVRAARRSAKRSKSWASSTGWALLFLTSGRMPPPPPASQIEAELDGEKDRLGSRSIDPE